LAGNNCILPREHSQIFAKFQKSPWLVPKLQLWNLSVSEASLLITGSMSFLHNCVPKSELGNELNKLKQVENILKKTYTAQKLFALRKKYAITV